MLRRLRYRLAWFRWLFSGPNEILLSLRGVDKASRDVLFDRWLAKKPKE